MMAEATKFSPLAKHGLKEADWCAVNTKKSLAYDFFRFVKLPQLWLQVENNSKFVRGKGKVRNEIEQFILSQFAMEKIGQA